MTPDKLRRWLARNVPMGASLQLSHESVEGGATVFQKWRCEALPEDLVQAIYDCCGEYADSIEEAARCKVEVLDEDGESVASTIHKAKPEAAATLSWDAANADGVSQNTIVNQLLRHIEVQQRVLSGSNLGAFRVLSETLSLQQRMNERLTTQLTQVTDKLVELQTALTARFQDDDDEDDGLIPKAETAEESRSRARALDRVTELLPLVAEGALRHIAGKSNGHAGPEMPEAPG